jgi:PAS domain S-box-containing protein
MMEPSAGRRLTSAPLRYGLALASVAVAALAASPLGRLLLADPLERLIDAVALQHAAVVFSAWLGGIGPGLLAVVLATLTIDYLVTPALSKVSLTFDHLPRLAVFTLSALLVGWLNVRRRRMEESLQRSHDELDARVRERTTALTRSNQQLHDEVAARKRAEQTLRGQAELLDLTHDTVFVRDAKDVITYWNRGAVELYGWTQADALGRVAHDLLQTVFPAPFEDTMTELTCAGRWEGELVHTRRDGTTVVVASRWAVQRDEQGRYTGILETNNDITARTRGEELLRRQANLLEQTHDAVFVWEFPRTIVYWNRAAEQLYGFSRAEAIGRVAHELLHTKHPLPTPLFEAELEREGEWTGELTHTTRDGRQIIVESRHRVMREPDGRRLVLETNRDITERKRSEESLRQAQAELAHVTRVTALGELAASIAHEINQPLAAIIADANACLHWLDADRPELASVREALGAIVADGERSAEVLTRIRALLSRSLIARRPCDVDGVVRDVLSLAGPELKRHGMMVETSLAADVPPVLADEIQLQQVLLNLLLNAAEASREMGPERRLLLVRTTLEDHDDRPCLLVAVKDRGVGFREPEAARLFEAFYTTKSGGLGMGLSISRSIIEGHGGRLWATANPDHGATFTFALPVTR